MTEYFIDVVAGPDAGKYLKVFAGETRLVGRSSSCDLSVLDSQISAQHLLISVTTQVQVRDLDTTNGTVICALESRSVVSGAQFIWDEDALVQIGSHILQLRPVTIEPALVEPLTRHSDTAQLRLVRSSPPKPTQLPNFAPKSKPTAPTEPRTRQIPWLGLLTSALGGLVVAAVFRTAFMLLFSLLAPAGMLAQFAWEKRRNRLNYASELAEFTHELTAHQNLVKNHARVAARFTRLSAFDPAYSYRQSELPSSDLWHFSARSPANFPLLLGFIWDDASLVPFSLPLGEGPVGIFGSSRFAPHLLRWFALQIANSFGPGVAQISGPWSWMRHLPHKSSRKNYFAFHLGTDATFPSQAFHFAVTSKRAHLPYGCRIVIEVREDFSARIEDLNSNQVFEVPHLCGIGEITAQKWAQELETLRDEACLPFRTATFTELWNNPTPEKIASKWETGTEVQTGQPPGLLLGEDSAQNPVSLRLPIDGPHVLVGGTTGAGKSIFLRALVSSLALTYRPEHLALVLVDYKGGAAFRCLQDLPHVIEMVTDLEQESTVRTLKSLRAELRRREQLLSDHQVSDHDSLIEAGHITAAPRIVIVVDEMRVLADEHPELLQELVTLTGLGRSLGIHLVLATQRPGSVVTADMRANINTRIALRVQSEADSHDILGAPDAAHLDSNRPGSALIRVGTGAINAFQVSFLTDKQASEICDSAQKAAQIISATPPRRPWLPPLPRVLPVPSSDSRRVPSADADSPPIIRAGRRDHPEHLSQDDLTFTLGTGHLLIIGGPGSGRTSALRVLAYGANSPVHVIAARPQLIADPLATHVGTTVKNTESGTIAALCKKLFDQNPHPRLVLIDNFGDLIDSANPANTTNAASASWKPLFELFRRASDLQITVAIAGGRAALNPRISELISHRWVLNSSDETVHALTAIPRSMTIPSGPGGLIEASRDSLIPARLYRVHEPTPNSWSLKPRPGASHVFPPPPRLRPLPRRVNLNDLPNIEMENRENKRAASPSKIRLGVGGDYQELATFEPAPLLIAGPPGSGRSTALNLIAKECVRLGHTVQHLDMDAPAEQLEADLAADVLLIDDLDIALSWDPHAPWVDRVLARLRLRNPTIAAATTANWSGSFWPLLLQFRRLRSGVVLAPHTRGSNEIFGLDISDYGTLIDPPGRGVIVQGTKLTGLQMAQCDQS